jgi:hypothetical protein
MGGERNFYDGSAISYDHPLPAINVYRTQPILGANGRSEQVLVHYYWVQLTCHCSATCITRQRSLLAPEGYTTYMIFLYYILSCLILSGIVTPGQPEQNQDGQPKHAARQFFAPSPSSRAQCRGNGRMGFKCQVSSHGFLPTGQRAYSASLLATGIVLPHKPDASTPRVWIKLDLRG